MDIALRKWCETSFEATVERCRKSASSLDEDERVRLAERIVETEAFVQLARRQGLDVGTAWDVGLSPCNQNRSRVNEIPFLNASTDTPEPAHPEVLGWIHQFFISHHGSTTSRGLHRKSWSRKTDGVFYTPDSIVNYMLEQTLERRLCETTPERTPFVTILDPAAGCGAFLAAAYRRLLSWHLEWHRTSTQENRSPDVVWSDHGWCLTLQKRYEILLNCVFGVEIDPTAVEVTRRILWLILHETSVQSSNSHFGISNWNDLASNFKAGNALIGGNFVDRQGSSPGCSTKPFNWSEEFPQIATRGGFDFILGNPPYRRERDFKTELSQIMATPFGQRYRVARMDLWYFFLHRGVELLRAGGALSLITNAYWMQGTGAEKLIAALRNDVHLEELFLLGTQPIFPNVHGQHVIFRVTKGLNCTTTLIKTVSEERSPGSVPFDIGSTSISVVTRNTSELFRDGRIHVWPETEKWLERLSHFPRLREFGVIRQGIAENPASINRRTLERFHAAQQLPSWVNGEGVFSLQPQEVAKLSLSVEALALLKPYHDLCDLGRYWAAATPSRQLIYSTRHTCPEISQFPDLESHLTRFRVLLEARRETHRGVNQWWHLHWPRDERLWRASKLVVLQMAPRPSFVPTFEPVYVSFSTNVFVPTVETGEDLRYFCGLLNSRILWAWFHRFAKHRGIGLELNGHVLNQAPIRRIDFHDSIDVHRHDQLVTLVESRMELQRQLANPTCDKTSGLMDLIETSETEIDACVADLYQMTEAEFIQLSRIIDPACETRHD